MNEIIAKAIDPLIIIFLTSTMLACGLGLTVKEIFAPFRNVRLTISAALMNFLVVPFIAIAAAHLMGLEESLRYGLVLIAMGAPAEASPKFSTSAKGNVGLSVGLLVLCLGVAVVYFPAMLSVLLPDVQFDREKLLVKLCLTLALPIIVGLSMKARWDTFAHRLGHYMHKISFLSMVLVTGLLVILYWNNIIEVLGSWAIGAALIFVVVSFIAGYLLGWPDRGARVATGFAAAARNNSVALMVATMTFADRPKVLLMIVLTAAVTLIVCLPLSVILGRRASRQEIAAQ